jgi:ABC-type multidrug transport system fused ATPase/permease subunit
MNLMSLTMLQWMYAPLLKCGDCIVGKVVDSASKNSKLSASDMQGPSIFFVTGAMASFVRVYNFGLVKENSASRLKAALLGNCLEQDLNFFEEVGTGELLTTLEKDVVVTAEIFADKIPAALRSFNSALLGSVFLFRVSPYLCGVSLSTVPLVGIIAVALGKTSTALTSSLRELEKQQSVFVSERLRNIATVFVNNMQSEERDTFNKFSHSILSQSKRKYFINGIRMGFVNIATNASIIAVLYTGASMVGRGEITQGELTSFLMRSGFVGLGFSAMSTAFSDLRSSLTSAARWVHTYM